MTLSEPEQEELTSAPRSKIMLIALMVLVCAFLVGSQIFLKLHTQGHPLPSPLGLRHVGPIAWEAVCSLNVWLFGLLMLAGGLTWIYVIHHWEISLAYPMVSFSYVLMMLAAWGLLNEPVTWQKLIGTALVCAGAVFLAL